ncbi:MAG: hypothetical protein GY780_01540 [bacterium]|nr:hypothetical protein [bacterium]
MTQSLNLVTGQSIELIVTLAGEREIQGWFFLAAQTQNHSGQETLLDLINNPEKQFIPFKQVDDAPVVVIRKSQIVRLRPNHPNSHQWFGQGPECGDDCWPHAEIAFSDLGLNGRLYTGEMPPERRRVTDLLNHKNQFFVFESEDGPWIINKNLIQYLVPKA